jgi:FKBP-type peptidyl-prolyl cis-trans isomerase
LVLRSVEQSIRNDTSEGKREMKIVLLTFLSVFAMSSSMPRANSQSGSADDVEAQINECRHLAESTFQAFERADYVTAGNLAQSLETKWDAKAAVIKQKAPAIFEVVDEAMDSFVKLLKLPATSHPEPKAVEAAYRAYLDELSGSQEVIHQSVDVSQSTSGLVIAIVRHGTGRQAMSNDIALARLTGFVGDGSEFRRTKGEAEPIPLRGPGQIAGLREAASHLRIGDLAVVIIPPALAWGNKPSGRFAVPPFSTLTYFVEIMDLKAQRMSDVLKPLIKVNGVDAAIKKYRELQQQGFPDIYSGEVEINDLGYWLLTNGDNAAAIKVFNLNVEAHPESANVYDSLGEAYTAGGDKRMAIENYRKALALDPEMQTSAKALKALESK